MTALSADRQAPYKEGVEIPIPVGASKTIYAGSLVCIDGSTRYAEAGSDASGKIFVGVAQQQVVDTSGVAGTETVTVRRKGLFLFNLSTTATQADVGKSVFVKDDQTVALAANVTYAIYCGAIAAIESSTQVWVEIYPALLQTDVATHIADTSAAHAASAISIADAGSYTSQTTVEAALQEIYPKAPVAIADPGASGAIPVTRSGHVAITTAGAETRTLAIPGVAGITLSITLAVDGGDCVITSAQAFNQTGNNTITLGDAGDTIVLTAVTVAGALRWRVVVNDGCTLTTV